MTSSTPEPLLEAAPATAVTLGAALKSWRKDTGRSLQALGQRVGLSTSTLSRYECGQSLPTDDHLTKICKALDIPDHEQLQLISQLHQARTNTSAARQTTASPQHHSPRTFVAAMGRHGRTAVGMIIIAFALIGVVTTVNFFLPGTPTGSDPSRASSPAAAPTTAGVIPVGTNCDRYTVGATSLALRDVYGGPISQLPRETALTVIQHSHPHGLQYWEVTTTTNQQGWVDPRYLRPAC
jgi:DNA-binding XRE family transcriptional regulator